jgi:TolB-like protein
MRSRLRCLTLALLCGAAPEALADKPKLVVMPLQSSGLAPTSVATLDELLADFVRRLGMHQVIGKSDIDAMLGLENMKDQLGCDNVSCAAEIGGALGAQMLLAGRVAKLGDNLIIVVKLIDAAKQQVSNSVQHKASNDENRYDEAVNDAVRKLFGLSGAEPAQPVGAPGSVRVASDALGQIWVDGKATGYSTPYLLSALPAGEHNVKVRGADRWGERIFRLDPGQTIDITVDVNRAYEGLGGLRVVSKVADVTVAINGKVVGKAPQLVEGLSAGEHRLTLTPSSSELMANEEVVRVLPDEITTIDADFSRRPSVRLNAAWMDRYMKAGCTPLRRSGGVVVVDGELVGASCAQEPVWLFTGVGAEVLWSHHPRFGARVRGGLLFVGGTMAGEKPPELKEAPWLESYLFISLGEEVALVAQDVPGSGLGVTAALDAELGKSGDVKHGSLLASLALRFGWFYLDAGFGPRFYDTPKEAALGRVCATGDDTCLDNDDGGVPAMSESKFSPWMGSFSAGAEVWF